MTSDDPCVLPLDHALDITHLQRRVRALCQGLGLPRDATFRWMLGFSELACAAVPLPTTGAKVALRPLRRKGAIGMEMSVEGPGRDVPSVTPAWRWMDECVISAPREGWTRLVARKWEVVPA